MFGLLGSLDRSFRYEQNPLNDLNGLNVFNFLPTILHHAFQGGDIFRRHARGDPMLL
jgi:hypothetical protein